MSTTGDVHVGDIGTHYKGELQDAGAAFDPTAAISTVLIFQSPAGTVIKPAFVTTEGAGASQKWFLNYTAVAGFHTVPGTWSWQGKATFADGSVFRTNVETFAVLRNLDR